MKMIFLQRARTVPTISPFALKMETFLRVADLPYLVRNHSVYQ